MARNDTLTGREIEAIAEEAYVFWFPMLMGYRYAFATFLDPSLPTYRGAVNEIHGAAFTLDHTFKDVVTPNADTPYSLALLDLRAEPLILAVPEVADRYYVMQLEDLFGTNAHYVGSRATGSAAGRYLLLGPRWSGEVPGGFDDALRFETDLVFLIGRTQLLGSGDVAALQAVMDGYAISSLSAEQGSRAPVAPALDWPVWDDEASRDERFVAHLNVLLGLCEPVHPSERELMERFARIGIGPAAPFDADALDPGVRSAVRAGIERARERIAARATEIGEKVNGWAVTDAFGDRDFYGGDYILRAAAAMAGWGGNDKAEAYYPMAREDASGRPLDGSQPYRLTFTSPPPARAFWSVTVYDTSYDGTAGFLVENPIDRYLIGSRTDGLRHGDDGSLTIAVQHRRPEQPELEANWLPTPAGDFYLVLRIYWPEQAALDGTWTPPPVERAR